MTEEFRGTHERVEQSRLSGTGGGTGRMYLEESSRVQWFSKFDCKVLTVDWEGAIDVLRSQVTHHRESPWWVGCRLLCLEVLQTQLFAVEDRNVCVRVLSRV